MPNKCYFISDVHLHKYSSQTLAAFVSFCQIVAKEKARLYIMGDLFNAWLGEDMIGEVEADAMAAIRSIKEKGGHVYFQAGNRDFLVRDLFFDRTLCEYLPGMSVVEIDPSAGEAMQDTMKDEDVQARAKLRLLLDHGDNLCLNDFSHHLLSKYVLRVKILQRLYFAMPAAIKLLILQFMKKVVFGFLGRIIHNMYESSYKNKMKKTGDMKAGDIDADRQNEHSFSLIPAGYLEKLYEEKEVDGIIYGHLHSPSIKKIKRIEKLSMSKRDETGVENTRDDTQNNMDASKRESVCKIICMGDWGKQGLAWFVRSDYSSREDVFSFEMYTIGLAELANANDLRLAKVWSSNK